jgi:hypothetical protein
VRFYKRKLCLFLKTGQHEGGIVYWKEVNYWKRDRIDFKKMKEEFADDVLLPLLLNHE